MKLAFDRGGDGDRLLVLLHGLSATRQVWENFVAAVPWRDSWIAPDLRGHGASAHAESYALGHHAADVAELIASTGPWREFVVIGHSMGGVVALALASGCFGFTPARVFGLGIKVAWTDEELSRLRDMAAAPARVFATREEAIARYLKTSGLAGLIGNTSTAATTGVAQLENGWRLAADPKTASVGAPPMSALLAAAQVPCHLARGEADRMVTAEQLRAHDSDATDLAGVGHNAMVENPRAVWSWIEARLT